MVRPRKFSDDELVARASQTIATLSTPTWTLADVADGLGIHPATLVKRFGSKRQLLVAMTERWVASIPSERGDGSPIVELEEWLARTAAAIGANRNSVALFGDDLGDPARRDLIEQGWAREERYVAALVDAARSDGELPRAPEARLAAQILLDAHRGSFFRTQSGGERSTAAILALWAPDQHGP